MLYQPPHFRGERDAALQLMRAHPFATLTSIAPATATGEILMSHVPLHADETDGMLTLAGHLARANPHWQAWEQDARVLAVFHGGNGYVSPSSYTTRAAVPTWNYMVVHAAGRIVALHDSAAKEGVLKTLIDHHDPSYRSQWDALELPWREGMKAGIVAFRITVERLDAKFKLSQNRSAEDRARVAAAHAAGDAAAQALVPWMGEQGVP